MNNFFSKYIDKLFYKKWIIGICKDNIKDIIRSRTFNPYINWLEIDSFDKFHADPFILSFREEKYKILFEEYKYDDGYAKISLMTLDKNFRPVDQKTLLDTRSHLSYPFIITEDERTYVFPEAAQSGKLSCYEYDYENETLHFIKDILHLPLRDSTILKHKNRYWIFGTMSENGTDYKLYVFYSDSLLGTYIPHTGNPVKSGLNGTRSAGNFIEVDGNIFRPTQNCQKTYGESITINKVTELTEERVIEEPYMDIVMDRKSKNNSRMHTIHTINVMDDVIVVDGEYWTFSPQNQWKNFKRGRANKPDQKVTDQ